MNTHDELAQTIQKCQDYIKEKMIDNIIDGHFGKNKNLENQYDNLGNILENNITKKSKVDEPLKNNNLRTRSPKTILRVLIYNTLIREKKAVITFVKTLERIGCDKVSTLKLSCCGMPLVSKDEPAQNGNYPNYKQLGDWYVITHSSTADKKQILDEVSQRLGFNMKVDIISN